jgi:CubicO group peptidase (beta-lactamase class C family)
MNLPPDDLRAQVEKILSDGISDGAFPGATFAYHHDGKTVFGAVGRQTYCPDSPEVTKDTIYDLASVSKVIGTTSAAMLCVRDKLLDIEQPVVDILPEFSPHGKSNITFRNLLVHDSGLIAFRPFHKTMSTAEEVLAAIYEEKLVYPTGTKTVYSDLNMILLAKAIERVTLLPLEKFLTTEVFQPLQMLQTGYFTQTTSSFVTPVDINQVAPTERMEDWRIKLRETKFTKPLRVQRFGANPEYTRAEVHDPTATVLGGVAGHAGLFAPVTDIVKFVTGARELIGANIFDQFTHQASGASSRALGWDTYPETGEFGHTGFTGTSIRMKPSENSFSILLTNRVHPSADNPKILEIRKSLSRLTA